MAKRAGIHQLVVLRQVCLSLTIIMCLYHMRYYVSGGEPVEKLILVNGCACLNETITYECTVKGGIDGATVWSGSAFNCSGNDINILHSPHLSGVGTCNNGAIVAHKLADRNTNGFYTSQLNVTISSDVIGKSVECAYVYERTTTRIGAQIIAASNSPPDKLYISLVDIGLNRLSFTWSPVAVHCPHVKYNILASNCGNCPSTTSLTTVTCTDIPCDSSLMCAFAVQTVVCDGISENSSAPITWIFLPENQSTNKMVPYKIAVSFLVSALTICIVIFISVIIVSKRKKIKAAIEQWINMAKTVKHTDSTYECVAESSNDISTRDNVAYGHAQLQSSVAGPVIQS